jgi:hypothetical protein
VCSLGLFIIFSREHVAIKELEFPETHFLNAGEISKVF